MKYIGYEDVQELLLVCGHPGSGKSTIATEFEWAGYRKFENDAFFTDEEGVYKFDFAFHQKAKDVCLQKTKNALDEGAKVVVANTFTTLAEMSPYLDYAKEKGIPVRVIEMELNLPNVHDVPDAVVQDKKNKFEPYEGALKVYDTSYRIVPQSEVETEQFLYEVSPYDGTGEKPQFYVAESLAKMDKVVNNELRVIEVNHDELEADDLLDAHMNDYTALKNVSELFKRGRVEEAGVAIKHLDTYVREAIPDDICVLLGGTIHEEKRNSARFNDFSATEIRENFIEIAKLYTEDVKAAEEKDKVFTEKFFADADMIISVENTRKRRLGY